MKMQPFQFNKLAGVTLLTAGLFGLSGACHAATNYHYMADSPGSTKGNTVLGKFKLTISDPDGIRWYQIASSGAKQPLKGYEHVDGKCQTSIPILLDTSLGVPHHVQFEDCSGDEEGGNDIAYAFEQKLYTNSGNNAGVEVDWIDFSDDDDDDDEMTVIDMNVDGIPDVVVFDQLTGLVTVLIGNGDGSLQDPANGVGRVIALPVHAFD